jgi:hypothetical protein
VLVLVGHVAWCVESGKWFPELLRTKLAAILVVTTGTGWISN